MRWMLVAALLVAVPGAALAQIPYFLLETDPIFRDPPKPYVAPGRFFSLNLPGGWEAFVNPSDPETVEGIAVGLSEDGALRVQASGGLTLVTAGEVLRVRPAGG